MIIAFPRIIYYKIVKKRYENNAKCFLYHGNLVEVSIIRKSLWTLFRKVNLQNVVKSRNQIVLSTAKRENKTNKGQTHTRNNKTTNNNIEQTKQIKHKTQHRDITHIKNINNTTENKINKKHICLASSKFWKFLML